LAKGFLDDHLAFVSLFNTIISKIDKKCLKFNIDSDTISSGEKLMGRNGS